MYIDIGRTYSLSRIGTLLAHQRRVVWFLIVGVLLTLPALNSPAQSEKPPHGDKKDVLLLHSYHRGMQWVDHITEGVYTALDDTNLDVELHIEYMDTKRVYNPDYLQRLQELYASKYKQANLDVVITADNNATSFAYERRKELFPDVPIVFCGLNHYEPGMFSPGGNITGVVESWDAKSTLETALSLHPETEEVVIVNDDTPTGKSNKKRLEEILPTFRDRVSVRFIGPDLTMQELKEELSSLDRNTIVLLMSFNRDAAGKPFSYRRSIQKITPACDRPIYAVWDFYLGHGIVGGRLTAGSVQGRKAFALAAEIMRGQNPATLDVVTRSPNRYMFDYEELQKYGISLSALPEDSNIINRPETFYSQYGEIFWTAGLVIVGLVLFIFILCFNIRRRKRAEAELRSYQGHLEQLVEERTAKLQETNDSLEAEMQERNNAQERLQKALRDLRTSNQELEQFAYAASHDLQEPLRKVMGFGERLKTLAGDQLNDKARDHLDRILNATERMQALINDLLAFSRISRKAQPFEQVDMNEVVSEVLSDLEPLIRRTEARIDIGDLCVVEAEPVQMRQLMQNLINNALKFHKENEPPFVKVYAASEGGGVAESQDDKTKQTDNRACRITVEDDGVGFDDQYVDHMFGIFQSLHEQDSRRGTGIGLAMCQRIAEYHGGRITAASTPNEGAQFTVQLPLSHQKKE